MFKQLESHQSEITNLCVTHNVKSLYAFRSVLTSQFNKGSDVDLLVEFGSIAVEDYADNYFDFKFSLEDVLKRPIELLEERAMRNPYLKKAIAEQRQLLYVK